MDNCRYDPPMPKAGGSNDAGDAPSGGAGNAKIDRLKNELSQAQGIMQENIDEVRLREENLRHLQDKTDNLAVSAQGFRKGANRVRKNMWWKDMKMRIIIGIAIVIILVIIIVPIVKATK
ncbi:synaptobrevin [Fomitiporia mediterranea MF3/22]|uniref:synaptobrevin n=1 Tax=Fomitiporia mediterranea (strain MF3/22) TaxID=694068 RepID=UPI0004408327|nr:synaptobrevin [Fomitiporia mediterranea MF3/22]EJD08455.1 synaptobrevin [Fomitiporia mediterranea MF3/22]